MTDIIDQLEEQLAKRHTIAFLWHIDDVKQQRPDLDNAQCWEVLKECHHGHDANLGMSWDVIDAVAEHLFGRPTSRKRRK